MEGICPLRCKGKESDVYPSHEFGLYPLTRGQYNSELTFWPTNLVNFFTFFPLEFLHEREQQRKSQENGNFFLQIDNGQEKGGLVWEMEKGQYFN